MFVSSASDPELIHSELAVELLAASEAVDRARAQQVAVAAEFDARMAHTADGAANAAAWLAPRARISRAEAHQIFDLGRKLKAMPLTAEAVRTGEVSVAQARVLSRVVNERTAAVFAEHEAALVQHAAHLSVDQLARAVRRWEAYADTDGADPAKRLHERRRASMTTGLDGMGHLEADLDPEGAAIVATELENIAQQLWRAEHPDETGEPPRTTGQRRCDALVEMARRATGADDHSPCAQPLVMVVTNLPALQGLAGGQADIVGAGATGGGGVDAQPIGLDTLRRLCCDSTVSRVVLGAQSEVLDVGRASRVATTAQRRALFIRDGGCVFPGCDRPPGWCQAHHVVHWGDGGPTDLGNMALICNHHHHLCHEGGWAMRPATGPPGWFEFVRPDGTVLPAEPARPLASSA